jgi:glycine/D-amino acid oxidase-like deaminating enzyme
MNHCYIIGGGIAGIVSGISAAELGYKVTLFEQQSIPFSYASSKNAAIFRTYESHPGLSILVKNSYPLVKKWEEETGTSIIRETGLFIRPLEVDYSEIGATPSLQSTEFTLATPNKQQLQGRLLKNNGVINLHSYLSHFFSLFKAAGGIYQNNMVENLNMRRERITGIQIANNENIKVNDEDLVLLAAGSWLSQSLLTSQLPFSPGLIAHKRHLFLVEADEEWKSLPVVWDELQEFYFRPDERGLLITHGDENPVASDDYTVDELAEIEFRNAAQDAFPGLAKARIKESRACLRTFTMDRLPVCGFDPEIINLFWQGGWGGRGISIAPSMIDYTISILSQKNISKDPDQNQFSPHRFI